MNWPKELIIKRDETNTKVDNKLEIISFIDSYNDIDVLENYLSSLKAQTKLDMSEVVDIIDTTQNRLNFLKKELEDFVNSSKSIEDLSEFYEENIIFVNNIVDEYIYKQNISSQKMEIMLNFLNFCINREKESLQNKLNSQNVFNKFYNFFKNNNAELVNNKYKILLNSIVDARDIILNKKDESAMEYSEVGYTKVLVPSKNEGYKLIESDDNITKLGSAAFITTSIILQATLIISFVLSLLALVK